MESTQASIIDLGSRIRSALAGETSAVEDISAARAAFLEHVALRNAKASKRAATSVKRLRVQRLLWASTAVATCAVALAMWLRMPASFQVGSERAVGRLGDLIEATTLPVPVRFSEGSSISVAESTRMRVVALDREHTRVLLEDGRVDVSVVPNRNRRSFSIEAGPFHVAVTGTQFRVEFHAADQAFSLAVEEGHVSVSGGCQQQARTVGPGERFELVCQPKTAEAVPEVQATSVASTEPAPLRPATPVVWRELLAAGRLQDGLRSAERTGFAKVCSVATAKELLSLADAARLFGRSSQAMRALLAIRQRFPGSDAAATAAFTLGRIAFERQHAYADAAGWFATYLREQPSGPLMGDSFGRLMEARLRAGDRAGARVEAEQYLRRFPEGPYASEARGILSK